jgi:prepilin-type N-terminal cleavage/methylation domain-containing protein
MTKKNKGYSLIEMLIVIAIMAVLAGLATFSITMITKAKCQDAVQSFDSQLSNLWLRTKSIAGSQVSMYMTVSQKKENGVVVAYQADIYEKDSSGTVRLVDSTVLEGNPQRSKKCRVVIKYRKQDTSGEPEEKESFTISFDKSTGAVTAGEGDYIFYDTSGNLISTVHLNKVTGNHYYSKKSTEASSGNSGGEAKE